MNIQNRFFLIAGVMALFFSFGHAMWGRRLVLRDVRASEMPELTKHMLLVIWDQPTAFHFLSAVALLLASLSSQDVRFDALALFIAVVTLGFLLNYAGVSVLRNRAALGQIIPQMIAVAAYLVIIVAGISR